MNVAHRTIQAASGRSGLVLQCGSLGHHPVLRLGVRAAVAVTAPIQVLGTALVIVVTASQHKPPRSHPSSQHFITF